LLESFTPLSHRDSSSIEIMTTMRERHASMPPLTEAPAARERSFSAKLSVAAAERWKLVRQHSAYIRVPRRLALVAGVIGLLWVIGTTISMAWLAYTVTHASDAPPPEPEPALVLMLRKRSQQLQNLLLRLPVVSYAGAVLAPYIALLYPFLGPTSRWIFKEAMTVLRFASPVILRLKVLFGAMEARTKLPQLWRAIRGRGALQPPPRSGGAAALAANAQPPPFA
jgi:hypothetical protein